MNAYVIWIDREHAKAFQVSAEKMERAQFASHQPDHHSHPHDALDHQRAERPLFEQVAHHVREAEKLLILGPGVAKHHFQNFLSEHYPAVARRIVACETVDHPSDPQIAAYARRFFEVKPLAKAT